MAARIPGWRPHRFRYDVAPIQVGDTGDPLLGAGRNEFRKDSFDRIQYRLAWLSCVDFAALSLFYQATKCGGHLVQALRAVLPLSGVQDVARRRKQKQMVGCWKNPTGDESTEGPCRR